MLNTIFGSDDEESKPSEEKTETEGKSEIQEGEEGFVF